MVNVRDDGVIIVVVAVTVAAAVSVAAAVVVVCASNVPDVLRVGEGTLVGMDMSFLRLLSTLGILVTPLSY